MRALVTGAASGIGRATCLRLARDAQAAGRKAQIAVVDLGPSPALDALVKELGNLGAVALSASRGHGDGRRARPRGGRGGGALRRPRRAGEQRGREPARAARQLRGRGLGPDVRGEHARDVAPRQGGPRRARGGEGRDRRGGIHVGQQRPRQPRALRAEQGRGHHARVGARAGVRARRHPRQQPLARHGADRHDREGLRRPDGGERARRAGADRARRHARGHGRRDRVPPRARRPLRQRPRSRGRRWRDRQLPRPPARYRPDHPQLIELSAG